MRIGTHLPDVLPTTFADLMGLHALRPIVDGIDLANATEMMDRLAVINLPTPDQADYLLTLSLLVEAYEAENDPVELTRMSGVQMLRHLMGVNEMSGADVGRVLGIGTAAVSMILSGRRSLTAAHANKLGRRFAVKPGAFIAE